MEGYVYTGLRKFERYMASTSNLEQKKNKTGTFTMLVYTTSEIYR